MPNIQINRLSDFGSLSRGNNIKIECLTIQRKDNASKENLREGMVKNFWVKSSGKSLRQA